MITRIEGMDGQIEVYEDRLVIKRMGWKAKLFNGLGKGEKEIRFDDITSVQIKEPGWRVGYIQFGQKGYSESKGGLLDAGQDENTVQFRKDSLSKMKRLKDTINSYKESNRESESEKSNYSGEDAVEILKKKFAKGEIDKEEYEERLKLIKGT